MTSISRRTRAALTVRAAIDFLAQDHRADRALDVHHVDPVSGRCGSCGHRWPCSIAVFAQKGAEKAVRDDARAAALLTDHRLQADRTDRLSADTGGAA